MNLQKNYKIVDLFCGCGGISRGFQWTGRFSTEFGVEIAKHPITAFTNNIRNLLGKPPHVYHGDIIDLTNSRERLWVELSQASINSVNDVDVIVAGPPCQGFSRNGTRKYVFQNEQRSRFYDDPRNHLYKAFLQVLEEMTPKLVLIENVREFLNFGEGKFSSDLLTRLGELGYVAKYKKICAADYGVPQMRYRVFVVAMRKQLLDQFGVSIPFPQPILDNELTETFQARR